MSDEGRLDPTVNGAFSYGVADYIGRYANGHYSIARPTHKTVRSSDFAADMWDIIDRCGNLLLDKQEDYGPSNISRAPGGPLNGLRVRIYDKISRINNLIDTGADPHNESLRDSFVDLANYAVIALMVLDGVWPELEDN